MSNRYVSDFKDAISLQCLGTFIFMYFVYLTNTIFFGGLLGILTHNNMGVVETIVSAALCGIVYATFSGQPLIVLGSTGPLLVFEVILLEGCE